MANSTVALRKGDYDLFGASAVYTVPRAVAVNYVGPLWSKGSLAMIRKEDADKFKTVADLNSPDVTFSVNAGASEEQRMPQLFPKAKIMATAGQVAMAAEPVRDRTGHGFRHRRQRCAGSGETQCKLGPSHRSVQSVRQAAEHLDGAPRRHGLENFMDMWATFMVVNGEVQRLYDRYLQELT